MKPGQPLFAFVILLIVHSIVSFAAYKFLTQTTRTSLPVDSAPVEITTQAQRARGESSFQIITEVERVTVVVPRSVQLYVIFGYGALVVTLLIAVFAHFREQSVST